MPKVTEEHVEARRRQILSAALRCFAREGFHRTTMQDIFREADLSPGAVYSYFKGKDELIAGDHRGDDELRGRERPRWSPSRCPRAGCGGRARRSPR